MAVEAEDSAAPLREAWYYAAPSRAVRRGGMLARQMLGEPVLLGRNRHGRVFALRDICPHRGMPLSEGGFDGGEIECCYHGWRFTTEGRCTAIPSLVAGQDFDLERIGVPAYPAREAQGNIWVFFGSDSAPRQTAQNGYSCRRALCIQIAARIVHQQP